MSEIILAENGRSKYSILVPDDAPKPVRFAGEELQKYLKMIGGVDLPIQPAPETGAVIELQVSDGKSRALQGRGEDAYVMRSKGSRIVLTGSSPRATLYAVYHFLEKYLACGWCAPGDDAVPKRSTIRLPAFHDVVGPPAFSMRQIILFPYGGEYLIMNNMLHTDWLAKNRFNWAHPAPNGPRIWEHNRSRTIFTPEVKKRGLYLEVGGHTFNTWVPNDSYAADHPEYFAVLEDGSRTIDGTHKAGLCVANPDVVDIVAENMSEWLDANPEADAVDLWHNDSHTYCRCPQCTPPGLSKEEMEIAYTGAYIRFCNQVAEIVSKRHPRALINLLSYFHTTVCPPDTERLHDNILVGLCLYPRPGQRTMRPIETSDQPRDKRFRAELTTWPKVARQFYVYEYYTVGDNYKLWSMMSMMCEDIRYFQRLGIDGISSDQWGPGWYPLNMYAFGKLTWNPDLSAEEIIEDFCTRYYGGASEPMIAYWGLLEDGLRESWRTDKPIDWRDGKRLDQIKKALSLADSEPVERRVRRAAELHQLAAD